MEVRDCCCWAGLQTWLLFLFELECLEKRDCGGGREVGQADLKRLESDKVWRSVFGS